ncbi:hypothetical protein NKH18_33580 [Streptomyces sp. M10(2022)]
MIPPESRTPFPGGPGTPWDRATACRPTARWAAARRTRRSRHLQLRRVRRQGRRTGQEGPLKPVLLGVGVFVLFGIAYGAGLLLNHSEVPKGTTVLGADIGGGTKAEAVSKLEASFGERAEAPLQLSVDGKEAELLPEKAGLSLDSQETVRGAAGSDYNPVSVISSLFGGSAPPTR